MLKKNQIIVITITDQGKSGDGLAQLDGRILYIPNTLPGDLVRCQLIKLEKRRCFARLLDVLTPSIHRVEPKCRVAHQCGGCQMQHQSQESQLRFKQELILSRLQCFIPLDASTIRPIISHPNSWEFRNKMQFSFSLDAPNNYLKIGLYASRSHRVVDTPYCPIMPPIMNDVLSQFRLYFKQYPQSIFNELTGKGALRHLTIRYSHSTQDVMVILTVGEPLPDYTPMVTALRQIPTMRSIYISQQDNPSSDQVIGEDLCLIWGQPSIKDHILSIPCQLSPRSFMQSNSKLVDTLYQTFSDLIIDSDPAPILDLYCGTGLLTIACAKTNHPVIGIDNNPSAVQDAIANASAQKSTASFICANAEDYLLCHPITQSIVLLDPPRKGLHPNVIAALLNSQPKTIGLMACSVDTLGRDLRELTSKGYQIDTIQPVDMFCHTPHLEIIVKLNRI